MRTPDLAGVRVLVTRAEHQSAGFSSLLQSLGASVVAYPTIEIRQVREPEVVTALEKALDHLAKYRWVLFSSANAVDYFFQNVNQVQRASMLSQPPRWGVIGDETARALQRRGFAADLCPEKFEGEAFVQAIVAFDGPALAQGEKVLLLRAREGRDVVINGLKGAGAQVEMIPIYETVASSQPAQRLGHLLSQRSIDCVTFTSSSTVKHFFEKLSACDNAALPPLVFACIGPVTAATLREFGIEPQVQAKPYTSEGLAQALAAYYKQCKERPSHAGTK